jgi:hypothetical protein
MVAEACGPVRRGVCGVPTGKWVAGRAAASRLAAIRAARAMASAHDLVERSRWLNQMKQGADVLGITFASSLTDAVPCDIIGLGGVQACQAHLRTTGTQQSVSGWASFLPFATGSPSLHNACSPAVWLIR